MANNLIQIKRSTTTDAPSSLANGELAVSFTNTSNSIFVGDPRNAIPGTPLRVGGGKYSFLHQSTLNGNGGGGVLTSNAVVITNANNYVDQFKTNTLVIGPDGTTNSSATFVVAGTADVSSDLVVGGNFTVDGTSTYSGNVDFDSGTLFVDSVNNRVGVNNSTPTQALTVTGQAIVSGNTTLNGTLQTIAGNVNIDSGTLFVDSILDRVGINNTTPDASLSVTGTANVSGAVRFANVLVVTGATTLSNTIAVTGNATISNTLAVTGAVALANTLAVTGITTLTGNATLNGALQTIEGNVNFDTRTLFVDATNNRVGVNSNTTNLDTDFVVIGNANVSGNVTFGGGLHTIAGNVNFDSRTLFIDSANNRVGINTNTTNLDASLVVIGTANVSGAVALSNTIVVTGAATFSNTVGVTGATTLANTLGVTGAVTLANTLAVTGTSTLTGNVSMEGALQTISGNVNFDTGTLFVDATNNRVGVSTTTPDASFAVSGTANVSGNTVVGGKLSVTGAVALSNTFAVTGAATLSNTFAVTGAATFSNTMTVAANLAVDTNVLLVDVVNNRVGINDSTPATALSVGGDAVISANLTANNLLVNADTTINGNLYVNGVLTTIDTVNLVVEDPLFKVGKNNNVANNAGDVVDLGFYGVYSNNTTDFYTGLFRDASDGKFRLFKDLETEPSTTVDTSALTYKTATLITYLDSGALSTNTSALAITANSSYSVTLVANTLSLSTALPVTSGGTGQQSFTAAGVIYGNGSGALQVTAAGANGDVLQVINNLPTFSTLDGGTF